MELPNLGEVIGIVKEKTQAHDQQEKADKITSLLKLKAHLEQELRANTRKIEELKIECDLRRRWIYFLDNSLSEASFQPASELVDKLNDHGKFKDKHRDDEPRIDDDYDFSKPVNISNPETGTLLTTINFLEGNALIAFNEKVAIKGAAINDVIKNHVLTTIEKEGGKVFIERDEITGVIRSITGIGTFKTEAKEKIVQGIKVLFSQLVDMGESLP
nr:hypothetical protein [Candidatus Sigynarchaeota archaeon]